MAKTKIIKDTINIKCSSNNSSISNKSTMIMMKNMTS